MRRLRSSAWLVLEAYALLLALIQLPGGVRTDEAKYLLSIPYPHPPLLRSIFAFTSSLPMQEFLWRFVIASALVQGVWLLWDIGNVLKGPRRIALAVSWLLCSAVITQAGTVMMAPLTGLFGLVCVWLALNPTHLKRESANLVGCLWFIGIFSAYQTVLYVPLIISALRSAHVSWKKILVLLGIPFVLLVLYTLSNPLALASMITLTGQDGMLTADARFQMILLTSLVAGSGILTVVGGFGLLTSGRFDLIATLVLVFGFLCISVQPYYAILLTPLLIAGLYLQLCRRRVPCFLYVPLFLIMSVLVTFTALPPFSQTAARATMNFLREKNVSGLVLIDGPFGHEWQYESVGPIGRFTVDVSASVESEASVLICTKKESCEDDINRDEWVRENGAPVEVWVKK